MDQNDIMLQFFNKPIQHDELLLALLGCSSERSQESSAENSVKGLKHPASLQRPLPNRSALFSFWLPRWPANHQKPCLNCKSNWGARPLATPKPCRWGPSLQSMSASSRGADRMSADESGRTAHLHQGLPGCRFCSAFQVLRLNRCVEGWFGVSPRLGRLGDGVMRAMKHRSTVWASELSNFKCSLKDSKGIVWILLV